MAKKNQSAALLVERDVMVMWCYEWHETLMNWAGECALAARNSHGKANKAYRRAMRQQAEANKEAAERALIWAYWFEDASVADFNYAVMQFEVWERETA